MDLDDFGIRLRTRIEYIGREMVWNMDMKRKGWVSLTSGITRLRYGNWKERPLLWEVLSWTS